VSGLETFAAEIPYPGFAFPRTHPDRLFILGTLHGLAPARPDAAGVLEVGCGDGMNLVGMAAHAPGLQAVGLDAIDPAPGREAAAALGLRNVRLERRDLREAGDLGRFDYVIAHGLYAWVAAPVREALMALLGAALAPQGIAFLSYNALPGARMRTMLREMALLHASGAPTAGERVARARELFAFLAPWAADRPDAYGQVLAAELPRLRDLSTASLAHDDLGTEHAPAFLRDVVAHARRHGLVYLADAELEDLRDGRHPPGVDERLDALAGDDRVAWEQYADLLAGRVFRETLLCRADAGADPRIDPGRLTRLWVAPGARAGIGDAAAEPAAGGNGAPATGAVAHLTSRRPAVLSWDELRAALGEPDPGALAVDLWRGFRAGEVELFAGPARHVPVAGARPEASPVARWQAARGAELTNLRHEPVRLDDPLGRFLVRLCDGTRDRAALLDALVAGVGGELQLTAGGEPVEDGEAVRASLGAGLERNLHALAGLALLRA
jgi:hypothetical protein